MNFISVSQKRSCIGQPESARKVIQALGLRGIGSNRVHKDNNCIRGMINRVQHLVNYQFVDKAETRTKTAVKKPAAKKTTEKKDASSKK